jgi:hypothetical protein
MDKYPLIGVSICAVVLLVLGSLSNVVGYQSVKSTALNDSPLFTTRTQRATNQQQNSITSQYLGKGKGNLLRFPIRDNQTERLNKVIESIKKMDDKTFKRFIELCIQRARQDNTIKETNLDELMLLLHQLRTKPETITNSFINKNNYNLTSNAGCQLITFLLLAFIISFFIACFAFLFIIYLELVAIANGTVIPDSVLCPVPP